MSKLGNVKPSILNCERYFADVHIKMDLQKRQFGLVIKNSSMELQSVADSLKQLCAYILLRKMNGCVFGFCQARTIRLRQIANLFSCPIEFWHSGHNLDSQDKVLQYLRFLKESGSFLEIGLHKGSGR